MSLSEAQIRRYSRHILLPDVGGRGQQRLLEAAVRVSVGPERIAELVALTYLAAAGVGTLVLDGPVAEPPGEAELRWGLVFGVGDHARSRLDGIRDRIAGLNPDVRVSTSTEPDCYTLDVSPDARAPALAEALVVGGRAAARTLVAIIRGTNA